MIDFKGLGRAPTGGIMDRQPTNMKPVTVVIREREGGPVTLEIGELEKNGPMSGFQLSVIPKKEPNTQYKLVIEPGEVKKLLEGCHQALNGQETRALHITPKLYAEFKQL
jgi:hypothetical protein